MKWKLLILLFFLFFRAFSQEPIEQTVPAIHELTVYVIPSAKPLNWNSPSFLYRSYYHSYLSRLLSKHKTTMGHLFIKFTSPLIDETLYTGMTTLNNKEQKRYFLKHKIGLGILGVPLSGKMEIRNDLENKIDYYARKDKLAFITFHINEEAALRIIEYLQLFTTKFNETNAPSDFYGGAFWPRYEYEGAGCTAFVMAMLDVAGIMNQESENWLVRVNIPSTLIGGEFNHNHKINKKMIKKTHCWCEITEDSLVQCIPFSIYDPSRVYSWILDQRNLSREMREPAYLPSEEANVPGLIADKTQVKINKNEPIFLKRPHRDIFIENYYLKIGIK